MDGPGGVNPLAQRFETGLRGAFTRHARRMVGEFFNDP
jgi:hypothetical protein